MDKALLAKAFNEWMRLYMVEPERFERAWREANTYLNEVNAGVEPSYGRGAAEFLLRLIEEVK